jgi:stage III sporulation protein AF
MENIYSWVKNIIIYFILITVIENALPKNNYRKYMKVFTGMILVILVISPFIKMLNIEDKISYYYELEDFKQNTKDMENSLLAMDEVREEKIMDGYSKMILGQVEGIVESFGYYPVEVRPEWEQGSEEETYGQIYGLTLIVARKEQTSQDKIEVEKVRIENGEEGQTEQKKESIDEINMKNAIADFYNISVNNINVSIQG